MKCEACREFNGFFRYELNKQNNTAGRLFVLFIKNYFKIAFKIAWNNGLMLQYNYTRNQYGRRYITLSKCVNH